MSSDQDNLTWKRIEPTESKRVWYRTVVEKMFVLPDGEQHSFTTIGSENEHAGACIAITADNKVIVAKQFRPGPEKVMFELPGGGVEEGEDPQTAVVRELAEETGYIPGNVQLLGTSCRDAYMNGTWHYYLATDCVLSPDGQNLDEHEHIDVCLISIDELLENARNDLMTDAVAVLLAYETLAKLRSKA